MVQAVLSALRLYFVIAVQFIGTLFI